MPLFNKFCLNIVSTSSKGKQTYLLSNYIFNAKYSYGDDTENSTKWAPRKSHLPYKLIKKEKETWDERNDPNFVNPKTRWKAIVKSQELEHLRSGKYNWKEEMKELFGEKEKVIAEVPSYIPPIEDNEFVRDPILLPVNDIPYPKFIRDTKDAQPLYQRPEPRFPKKTKVQGWLAEGKGIRKSCKTFAVVKEGTGDYKINGKDAYAYFGNYAVRAVAFSPLLVTELLDKVDVKVWAKGSGINAQSEAVAQAVANAIVNYDPSHRPNLKMWNHFKRDIRRVERKKAGFRKARKKEQFSKR